MTIVFGQFTTIFTDFASGSSTPDEFRSHVNSTNKGVDPGYELLPISWDGNLKGRWATEEEFEAATNGSQPPPVRRKRNTAASKHSQSGDGPAM